MTLSRCNTVYIVLLISTSVNRKLVRVDPRREDDVPMTCLSARVPPYRVRIVSISQIVIGFGRIQWYSAGEDDNLAGVLFENKGITMNTIDLVNTVKSAG